MKRTLLVSFLAVAALGLLVAFAVNSRSVPVEAHIRPGLGHSIDEPGIGIAREFLARAFA